MHSSLQAATTTTTITSGLASPLKAIMMVGLAVVLAQVSSVLVANAAAAATVSGEHLHLGQKIANAIRHQTGWPDWVILLTVSALPIVELRGGVPVGIWMGIPPLTTMALACIGNFIPVPFIILALNKLDWLIKKVRPVVEKKMKDVTGTTLNWQYLVSDRWGTGRGVVFFSSSTPARICQNDDGDGDEEKGETRSLHYSTTSSRRVRAWTLILDFFWGSIRSLMLFYYCSARPSSCFFGWSPPRRCL